MFITLVQKVSFVVGCLYLVAVFLSALEAANLSHYLDVFVGTAIWVGLLAIFWHFTGVLKPVVHWFKGK